MQPPQDVSLFTRFTKGGASPRGKSQTQLGQETLVASSKLLPQCSLRVNEVVSSANLSLNTRKSISIKTINAHLRQRTKGVHWTPGTANWDRCKKGPRLQRHSNIVHVAFVRHSNVHSPVLSDGNVTVNLDVPQDFAIGQAVVDNGIVQDGRGTAASRKMRGSLSIDDGRPNSSERCRHDLLEHGGRIVKISDHQPRTSMGLGRCQTCEDDLLISGRHSFGVPQVG